MVFDTQIDIISVAAILISFVAFTERWRGGQRARQEANILILSNHISEIYEMVDENLSEVLKTRGKVKLKDCCQRSRFLMLQKLHIHLDSLQMMIKMEGGAFRNLVFGKRNNDYYRELVEWYCSVHKFYNDLLDLFKIKDSSFLHDGMKDPHRTHGKPPLFLMDNEQAIQRHMTEYVREHDKVKKSLRS